MYMTYICIYLCIYMCVRTYAYVRTIDYIYTYVTHTCICMYLAS